MVIYIIPCCFFVWWFNSSFLSRIYASNLCVRLCFSFIAFIWRKKLFAKISITEKGVVIFYKKEIIKAMKWEEIKDAMVNINSANLIILISDKEYDINAKSGKQFIAKNNHGISLNFAIKYVYEEMSKSLKKIPVKLKNFDKLPIETQTILREMMSK